MNEVAKRNTLFATVHCEEFIFNSIAFKTGHFMEMVELVNRILSLQLTDVENKTFEVKTLIKHASIAYSI